MSYHCAGCIQNEINAYNIFASLLEAKEVLTLQEKMDLASYNAKIPILKEAKIEAERAFAEKQAAKLKGIMESMRKKREADDANISAILDRIHANTGSNDDDLYG